MATKKKLLQAAAGTAAASGGAGALNVEDVFSTYLYEGNGDKQFIDNGINLGQANDGYSAYFGGAGYYVGAEQTTLTDFTVEGWIYFDNLGSNRSFFTLGYSDLQLYYRSASSNVAIYDGSAKTYSFTPSASTWYHFALVRNGTSVELFIDGVSKGTQTSSATISGDLIIGGYAGSTDPMNGYISNIRVSDNVRYSSNFTAPTSALTTDANTTLLTLQDDTFIDNSGNGNVITPSGGAEMVSHAPFTAADAGEGGLVWIKKRASTKHILMDSERGLTDGFLSSDLTNGTTASSTQITSLNSSGFSIGNNTDVNQATVGYNKFASWTFRKAPKFFTCVQYTGTGSSLTINHDLGVEPAVIIIKRTNTTGNWIVFTDVVDGTMDYLYLNDTSASADGSTLLSKSSTSFTLLQSFLYGNASGSEYVAYLFAHNDGDGDFGPTGDQDIIKCGSFTEVNGSDVTVDLGFEPQWIILKPASTTGNWGIYDIMRGWNSGGDDIYLQANLSNAEASAGDRWLINPNGFTWKNTANARDMIYIAIRRGPMAVPTDATDVFDASYGTSNGNTPINLGFSTDTMLYKNTSGSDGYISTRLTGAQYMSPNSTAAEATGGDVYWDDMDGIAFNNASSFTSWIFYNWRRAPSFCDVVAYTGNGTAGRTVSHNLGVAPEMMWVKRRDSAQDWKVYHTGLTSAAYYLDLNTTSGESLSSVWASTDPTSSVFSVGSNNSINASGGTYIAYLFASLDGVSKVGSYTGTGAAQNIDCGFTSGARFVLIKRTDSSGYGWMVLDTERGIVSGNDPRLQLNTTDAQVSNADVIDPYSGGFALTSTGTSFNASGGTYIFYAIA